MSTSIANSQSAGRSLTACAVCGSRSLRRVVELPALPLTGLFSNRADDGPIERFDQGLLVCPECSHGQLENQLDPQKFYGRRYEFRTSLSATARAGTEHFVGFVERLAKDRTFRCALDVGCNDLYLLDRLRGRAALRVGIDPIWAGCEAKHPDKSVTVIGLTFEAARLRSEMPECPDLILCRHTLEHLRDPRDVVERMVEFAAPDALFVFEIPGFDALVRKFRFDQVFHQHLQYFNLPSLQRMLSRMGARYLASCENYHDWGSLLVAFDKRRAGSPRETARPCYTAEEICQRYAAFREDMARTRRLLQGLGTESLFGYGAAQMLPVLAYSLDSDLSMLRGVLDDEGTKQGLHYQNLPLRVLSPAAVDKMGEASIFITAVDNVKPIMTKLLNGERPRHILCPLPLI